MNTAKTSTHGMAASLPLRSPGGEAGLYFPAPRRT